MKEIKAKPKKTLKKAKKVKKVFDLPLALRLQEDLSKEESSLLCPPSSHRNSLYKK